MGNLLVIVLLALAFVWGFWLIFKRNMLDINLTKLISYFMGVILTLLCVWFITARFLPWWANRLIDDTTQSATVQEVQGKVETMLKDIVPSDNAVVTTAVPVEPQPTSEPVEGATSEPQPITSSSAKQTHTVQSGDTLYSLSKKYGVTVPELQKANNLTDENKIQVGQELVIPPAP